MDRDQYRVSVTGLVNRTLYLTYADILADYPHYQQVATLHCEGLGVTIIWEGILVADMLAAAFIALR